MKEVKYHMDLFEIPAKLVTNRFKLIDKKGYNEKHSVLIINNLSNKTVVLRYENDINWFVVKPEYTCNCDLNQSGSIMKYLEKLPRIQIKFLGNTSIVANGIIKITYLCEI